MWGTHLDAYDRASRERFIPTHVGNTPSPEAGSPLPFGSSPRMWGTPAPAFGWRSAFRFIPTHVGNTQRAPDRPHPGPVHPHACGEHPCVGGGLIAGAGSSPRLWGTRIAHRQRRCHGRFIPTHVGNTHEITEEQVTFYGSSPRMWGTPTRQMCRGHCLRFIPTHVGNTLEDAKAILKGSGSSPRMWGTPRPNLSHSQSHPVHPHACGEYTSCYLFGITGNFLS